MTYIESILYYCNAVLTDTLPNRKSCKFEKLACQRHLDDLAKQSDENYPYYFSEVAATRRCGFTERLQHTKDRWRGEFIKLELHQIFMQGVGFGWLKKKNNKRRFTKMYFELPRKNGKALSLDTLIPTPQGWTTQGDLKVGDKVFDETGNPCNITNVTESMINRPCYKLVFSNGQEVIADEEHEWLTTARVNTPGERKEKKIRRFREPSLSKRTISGRTKEYWYANLYGRQVYIGDCLKISETQALHILSELAKVDLIEHPFNVDTITRIRTTKEIFNSLTFGSRNDINHSMVMPKPIVCEEVDLPISPYLFGSWLGDGNSNEFAISCGEQDVESFKGEILKEGFCFTQRRDRTAWRLFVRTLINGEIVTDINDSRSLNFILKQLNVYKNKHIPKIYLRSSFEQRLALLQGLMDTDGTVDAKGKVFQFVTILKEFAEDFCELVSSMGIKHSLIEKKMRCNGVDVKGTCYSIQFNVFKCELPVFRLQHKLDRMRELTDVSISPRSKTVQIVSCEPVESVPVRCITVDSPSHLYLFGKTMLPTHNSIEAATDGLFLAFADGIQAAEVYAGATTEAQAMMVFQPAWQMIKMNPQFADYYNVEITGTAKNPTSAFRIEDSSKFIPIVGKPGDGASPNGALVDEYHEHLTSVLYDAMDTGMGSREQPVLKVITTAGTNTSYPCYDLHCEAIKVLEGSVIDDSLFCIVFTIDEGDSWEDFEVWKKVNPNYLISIEEDYLLNKYRDALNKPQQRNVILTKHLNIWQNAGISFVDMLRWKQCEDLTLSLDMFLGQECWLALDLASKIDLCALVMLFKYKRRIVNTNCPKCFGEVVVVDGMNVCVSNLTLEDESVCAWKKPVDRNCVAAFAKHYMPEDTINRKENTHYQKWVIEGHLTKTDGARTDFGIVEKDIEVVSKNHIVKELSFDQKEATHIIHLISQWANFECVEFPQSPSLMNEPMQELEAMIAANEFWHSGDPIFTWCMGNIVKKQSRFGGSGKMYFPTKENDKLKIDSGVAAIMGLGRLITSNDDSDSYNSRAAKGEDEILRVL